MNAIFRGLIRASLLLLSAMPVSAEDIDLFVNAEASSSAPNVLFVIDNAADFSSTSPIPCEIDGAPSKLTGTVGGIEQCALHKVISELQLRQFTVASEQVASDGTIKLHVRRR